MDPYREFEHTADIGVEIYGDTLETLFQHAGVALFDSMVDLSTVTPVVSRTVEVQGQDVEMLLINWLRELLFLCATEQEVYCEFNIHTLSPMELHAIVKGEALDLEKHHFHTEIKAITYHQFSVAQEQGQWKARVIFDV